MEAALEAEASEAAALAAVDTAAADLGEDITDPADRDSDGALALDLDGALVPVITVADALAALWA